MVLGISLALMASGVVLLWIEATAVAGLDSATLGLVLLLAGAAGSLVALAFWSSGPTPRRRQGRRRIHLP